jgi:hypothetical protein
MQINSAANAREKTRIESRPTGIPNRLLDPEEKALPGNFGAHKRKYKIHSCLFAKFAAAFPDLR